MLDFLSGIADAIVTCINFLFNVISGMVQFLAMIPQFLSYATSVLAYIPSPLVVFISVGLTASVLLLVIGRN